MLSDYTLSSIYHIAKADFLQRVRSNYFLIALGVCVFIIYSFVPAPDAGYTVVSLGNYRGFYNSAWIGSMVATCVPFFTLIGFYIVNNAVQRDIETGVGQIIATTRISRLQYLTGKFLSNFAVLILLLLVISVMTVVMFYVRAETSYMEPGKLLLPLLVLTVPAMFILSALALVLDSMPERSRGFINVAYFILWIFIVSASLWSSYTDIYGVNTCILDITKSLQATHPDWNGDHGAGILIIDGLGNRKVFTWEGMNWTVVIILQRVFWMLLAYGFVVLSSLFFNRFDSQGSDTRKQRTWKFLKKPVVLADATPMTLVIKYRDLPKAEARFSFFELVKAELRLMFRGRSKLWLLTTSGLFIASVFAPLSIASKFILPLLWFFQLMNLSKLGSRELTNRCNEYIFSAAYPLRRQLPAMFMAAFLFTISLALPVMLRVFTGGDLYGVFAIATGSLFIPAFAIAAGTITGGSKFFEVVFTVMVYGLFNGIPYLDFTGAIAGSREMGVSAYYLAASIILIVLAFGRRKIQLIYGD